MLHNKKLPKSFWGEAVNTAYHTLNRVYFRPDSKKTPYQNSEFLKPRQIEVVEKLSSKC